MNKRDIFSSAFTITRTTAGPFMIIAGLFLLVLSGSETGAIQSVKLTLSGILVLGGMLVTYLGAVRDSNDVRPPPSTTGDLGLAVEQLSRNYEWIRSQTMYAFFLSASFMALGLLVILLGSARSVLGLGEGTNNLTTIAGILAEFISATALILYRSSSVRLNDISTCLHETWRLLAAYRLEQKTDPTRPITSWRSAWRSILRAAGIQCRFQDLRHTAVTTMAEKGLAEQTIMAQVGHISPQMMKTYSHIRRQALNAAAAALEPAFVRAQTQHVGAELVN